MVNSASMSSERAIPDLWEVFGSKGIGIRRNSWQKMQAQMSEEERAVTELFSDLHIHARTSIDVGDLSASENPVPPRKNSSHQARTEEQNNERNNTAHNWENIERHLSMKKTIRKKMMRDLQQAFIDSQDPGASQQWDHRVQLDAHKSGVEPNLLDMLKDNNKGETPQAAASQPAPSKKPGFWKKLTMGKKSKR